MSFASCERRPGWEEEALAKAERLRHRRRRRRSTIAIFAFSAPLHRRRTRIVLIISHSPVSLSLRKPKRDERERRKIFHPFPSSRSPRRLMKNFCSFSRFPQHRDCGRGRRRGQEGSERAPSSCFLLVFFVQKLIITRAHERS
jgi:hypothetical protein